MAELIGYATLNQPPSDLLAKTSRARSMKRRRQLLEVESSNCDELRGKGKDSGEWDSNRWFLPKEISQVTQPLYPFGTFLREAAASGAVATLHGETFQHVEATEVAENSFAYRRMTAYERGPDFTYYGVFDMAQSFS